MIPKMNQTKPKPTAVCDGLISSNSLGENCPSGILSKSKANESAEKLDNKKTG